MLQVDIRRIGDDPVATDGLLNADNEVFDGLAFRFSSPVRVDGELRETSEGDLFWRGRVTATVAGECRRCLVPVEQVIDDDLEALFSANPDLEDDPSVYVLPERAVTVNVGQAVREEIALRVSAFPLCRPDCKGLCATCGADLNAGPCGCTRSGLTS